MKFTLFLIVISQSVDGTALQSELLRHAMRVAPDSQPTFPKDFCPARSSSMTVPTVTVNTTNTIFVTVDIKSDRIDDFLKTLEADAAGSRNKTADPGCLRFDVLHDRDNVHRYHFYEVYKDAAALDFHKGTPHFKLWLDFHKSGGVENVTFKTMKSGGCAFQMQGPGGRQAESAIFVTLEIKPERVDEFLTVMQKDVIESRKETGCLRFDFLQDNDKGNKFYVYELYVDEDALDFHKKTAHFQLFAEFQKSGGVENVSVVSMNTTSVGDWALQQ